MTKFKLSTNVVNQFLQLYQMISDDDINIL